jgi:hypothetical protein
MDGGTLMSAIKDVLENRRQWAVVCGDSLKVMRSLPDNCAACVFGSPPYESQRTYSIGFDLKGQAWVDWLVEFYREGIRLAPMVAFVVEGFTKNFRWSATPSLLEADLHRAGFNLRHPYAFYRIGIPGSGGPDYMRNDHERIIVVTRPGKLPWSDNTSCGHPPKWAPGGDMSYRLTDGTRRNQWGGGEKSAGNERNAEGERRPAGRPSHVISLVGDEPEEQPSLLEEDPWGKRGRGNNLGGRRKDGSKLLGTNAERDEYGFTPHDGEPSPTARANGAKRKKTRLGRNMANVEGSTKGSCAGRRVPRGTNVNGEVLTEDAYLPPAKANPGNVLQQSYTALEVAAILRGHGLPEGDIEKYIVGGGMMGDPAAHLSEAPFPESLCEHFILSYAPPGGLVIDPFSGSGSSVAVAVKNGRRGLGIDIRDEQVKIARRRVEKITPMVLLEGQT